MPAEHHPVLLEEVLEALNVTAAGIYVDGTFGRGGHAAALLSRLDEAGRVFAFDRDPSAAPSAAGRFADDPRLNIQYVTPQDISKMVMKRYTGWWDDIPSNWTPAPGE